jgi:hypothetical protein
MFLLLSLRVDTSAGGLLVLEDIIRPVVNVSALTWFIRYICYWNLQFLNNVISDKTMVFLSLESVIWWRLFQKRVVHPKLDIYVFIIEK